MAGTVEETTSEDVVGMMSELVAQSVHGNEPHPPQMCPDDGACHHRCVDVCWRSQWCLPLSGYGSDSWPDDCRPTPVETT